MVIASENRKHVETISPFAKYQKTPPTSCYISPKFNDTKLVIKKCDRFICSNGDRNGRAGAVVLAPARPRQNRGDGAAAPAGLRTARPRGGGLRRCDRGAGARRSGGPSPAAVNTVSKLCFERMVGLPKIENTFSLFPWSSLLIFDS